MLKWIWTATILIGIGQVHVPGVFTLQHSGKTLMQVDRADYTLPALPLVDADKLERLVQTVERSVYQAPVNARIGGDGAIIAEQTGFKLDRAGFRDQFQTYFFGGAPSEVEVPRITVYPRVDSELLSYVRDKQIGQYVTYFNARNKNRSHNIALAAKAIDSHVVFPGETFSFNQTVGKRVKERGYRRAAVIVRGELAEDIGGGICQVSSTLFNAADRAGLKIVKRYSHSRHVPYVPPGRDATVSWHGPDFAFRNQYNQPVLIRAHAGNGGIRVAIQSSEQIQYKPKEVRSMTKRLPEEIPIDKNVNHPRLP